MRRSEALLLAAGEVANGTAQALAVLLVRAGRRMVRVVVRVVTRVHAVMSIGPVRRAGGAATINLALEESCAFLLTA